MTAVSGSVYTAAQFNTFVRDNLNETAPAKATQPSRLIVTDGANSIAERDLVEDSITTAETTASTTFADLATPGPSVTVTTGSKALVIITAMMSNSTVNGINIATFEVSGATTSAANIVRAVENTSSTANAVLRASATTLFSSLTPGSNTFTMKYQVNAGTGTFQRRNIAVLAL